MDLRHLRYFVCVAEEMHFGRAAARLGISQPPLSQQIRALEAELGVRLFDRNSRRVNLTAAGEMFLPEARATLAQAELAAQTARRAQAGELGQLRLGFTTSGPFVEAIAGALYAFRRSCPNVEFSLAELGRDEQIARVEAGVLDFGIIRSPTSPILPEGFFSTLILEEPVMLAMRSDHRLASSRNIITLSMLADEAFVLYNDTIGAGFNEHFTVLCQNAGFSPKVAQEAGSLATLLGLVSAGFGLTILTRSLTRLHLENVIYRPLEEPSVLSGLWLIQGSTPSPAGRSFLNCLRDTIQASKI